MTKSEFNAKYDECVHAFTQSIVSDNRIAKRLNELSNDGKTTDDCIASAVVLSMELNTALLRSVLASMLPLDDCSD